MEGLSESEECAIGERRLDEALCANATGALGNMATVMNATRDTALITYALSRESVYARR